MLFSSPGSSIRTPRTGSKGTPVRVRSDIQTDRVRRQEFVVAGGGGGDGGGEPTSELGAQASEAGSDAAASVVIWGTDVSINQCKAKMMKFVTKFVNPDAADDETFAELNPLKPYYLQRLEEVAMTEEPFLALNCGHIQLFDEDLYRQLVCYPQEVIPALDMAVNEVFFQKFPSTDLRHQIQVRPFNADKTANMRALSPEDIDQLITVTGMVIRASDLIPEMALAHFQCSVCRNTADVEIEQGRIAEPTLCTNCQTNHSFALVHNRSQFTDKQMVKLQESPDDMPAGQTPHTVILYVHNDLVDSVQPGDRVAVTGVYRAVPHRSNPKMRNLLSVYKTHIDVVHFRKTDHDRLHTCDSAATMDEETVAMLGELAGKKDIYERLSRAVAPSIYENEDVKKGILLQLFGGNRKDFSKTGRGNFRSELNILLCGDPGTSKSQLLQYVFNLIPRWAQQQHCTIPYCSSPGPHPTATAALNPTLLQHCTIPYPPAAAL